MRKIKFIKGKIYHIYNRGVEKRSIFSNNSDKWRFLQGLFLFNDEKISSNLLFRLEKEKGAMHFGILKDFFSKNQKDRNPLVRIMADCLMPNHYHLLIEEIQENGISRFMHKLAVGYTGYFNKKYDRVGSLFQGAFKAVPIESDVYLQYILAYINVVNPGQLIEPKLKEEGVKSIEEIMNFAKTYSFGTHLDYLGMRDSIIIDRGIFKYFFPTPAKYEEFVRVVLMGKKYNIVNNFTLE